MQFNKEDIVLKGGKKITKYQLVNNNGMMIEALSLGATLTKILVPDKEGKLENVILEWQQVDHYEENPGCLGAIIGRVAGRIYKGEVTIQNKNYYFAKNNNGNTLHGGLIGFHKKTWEAENQSTEENAILKLSYLSPDGEEGFPGNLRVSVYYILNNSNELTIKYEATTDKETIVNLTNHAYFNLSGDAKQSILNNELIIHSNKLCELDEALSATGRFLELDQNPAFDFRKQKTIGRDIKEEHRELKYGNGYDHPWLLDEYDKAVEIYEPLSGRYMEVVTDQPVVVMYTMNYADDPILLANGKRPKPNDAVCFETQKCPIGYNEVFKEEVLLKPGEHYAQNTTFKFSVK